MEKGRKVLSVLMIFSFITYYVGAENVAGIAAKTMEQTKDYIVCTGNEKQLEKVEEKQESSGEINGNAKELLQENHMTSVEMSEQEAREWEEESSVVFVEEDKIVRASTENSKKYAHRKVKKIAENKSKNEWNVRMIRSDKIQKKKQTGKKKNKEKKVKIAILDSGVDYGNDINVAKTITLVPGEEEMSPLFMDGTGHGDSVAGLIAACDDGEGITGINPNAEIYSIRVLDDENCAPVSRVVEGIYQAIEWKVNILNMSFGLSEYSAALEKAVKDAEKAGILIVASAGNTGEEGVQYPAAFDEVVAVGSVDKHGDVVESSAKGGEVELVAPGELVRSTGVLGEEIVESGTSLAAPQVAAVASLIWEQDLKASADFVRSLLRESANACGEKKAFGEGIIDAEYALTQYDTYKKQYAKQGKAAQLKENETAVLNFEETNCVKGSWDSDKHAALVPSANINVQKGARFPDTTDEEYVKSYYSNGDANVCIFARMTRNPWWHGYYKLGKSPVNYIGTYLYETRLANQYTTGNTAKIPKGIEAYAKCIRDDIGEIKWKKELKQETVTSGMKRAFLWGMAIHNLSDVYAHSTFEKVDSKWQAIKHPKADDTEYQKERYECAKQAVETAMIDYKANSTGGSIGSFLPARNLKTDVRMADIKNFAKETIGLDAANYFTNVTYVPVYSAK